MRARRWPAIAARLAARERPNNRYRELRNLGELVIGDGA